MQHPTVNTADIYSLKVNQKSFVKITSGNVEKRLKNPKNLKNFRKRPNASNCFRMHPNASQWVRMEPKASKCSRKPQKTCENFETLRKNFEKLREKFYKNFFHGVVCARLWALGCRLWAPCDQSKSIWVLDSKFQRHVNRAINQRVCKPTFGGRYFGG